MSKQETNPEPFIFPLKILKIQIFQNRSGTDRICITPDLETPYPNLKYPASIYIDTACGYAPEWVRKVFGREADEIIKP